MVMPKNFSQSVDNLKICIHCIWKKLEKNKNSPWPLKDVCFVCGEYVHKNMSSKRLVFKCLKHKMNDKTNNIMAECCVCKQLYPKNGNFYKMEDVMYCLFCQNNSCCEFDY